MEKQYQLSGLSCEQCSTKIEKSLSKLDAVLHLRVDAQKVAHITMSHPIALEDLQQALVKDALSYRITSLESNLSKQKSPPAMEALGTGKGVFYCPMHCEGEKTYKKSGPCPICGMDLLEQKILFPTPHYTCPQHPEIIQTNSGVCPICAKDLVAQEADDSEELRHYKNLHRKMKIALIFSLPILLISMGEMFPHNPLPLLLEQNTWNWLQFLLSLPVLFVCRMIFSRAYHSLISMNLNMFTLVGLGTGVAFVFSVLAFIFPGIFPSDFKTPEGHVPLYFEASSVILTLVLLGQLLEARAHRKTSTAIKKLLGLAPSETSRLVDEKEETISIHDVQVGDYLRVKPGDKIPVDGKITEGYSRIDESMISGEPVPVSKNIGDTLRAGSINGRQTFVMQAQKVGQDTLLAHIICMVNDASHSRAPIQKLADSIAGYFVPAVIGMAVVSFIIWALWGPEPALNYALVNAMAVLIISCPCALGLATPMAVMVGVGKGAQSGILIKNAEVLETLHKASVLIIDKTGTITEGKPSVHRVQAFSDIDEKQLINLSASLSVYSEHPLSAAILHHAKSLGCHLEKVDDFHTIPGKGVKGYIAGQRIAMGNITLMEDLEISTDNSLKESVIAEQKSGKTISYIATANKVVGFITISDAIKASSYKAIPPLIDQRIELIMMTGDNPHTAAAVAKELKIKNFKAGCLPEDKLKEVKKWQAEGKLVMVTGDGINDSPALAQADIGIAMSTGTDVAMESAEITLLNGDLTGISKALKLSHAVMKNIKQNLFFAFLYNSLGIPIAAGVLYPHFGLLLSPMIAAVAMSLSSVSVISNSLRLRSLHLNL